MTSVMRPKASPVLATAAIVAAAALLRVSGLGYDLPYIYHPDEPVNIAVIERIFKSADLNPRFFGYPTLFYYINCVAYLPYYVAAHLSGLFETRNDIPSLVTLAMGVTRAPLPDAVILGRSVTLLFGVATAWLTYRVGARLLHNRVAGMLAALMVAVSPSNVALSRFITPDTFVTFFALAALYAAAGVYREGTLRQYIVAGLLVGLAASTKYNGGLVMLSLIGAHLLRPAGEGRSHRLLLVALASAGAGFLAGTPFALLDFPTFFDYLKFEGRHYSGGHAGMDGNTLPWYLEQMRQTAAAIYVCAVLEIGRGLAARSRTLMLLSIFPLAYFLFISSFEVRNDRTFLPLTPFLFLLAASFLTFLFGASTRIRSTPLRVTALAAVACVAVVSYWQPIERTIGDTMRLSAPNSRELARRWIAKTLPAGSRIAIESYSPFIEPGRYTIEASWRITAHEPDWYVVNGIDYLVMSEGTYGRFFREPERFRQEVAQYETFFARFEPLRVFTEGGYEIRIYATPAGRARL